MFRRASASLSAVRFLCSRAHLLVLLLVLLGAICGFAQGVNPGHPTFSASEGHEFYSISLADLHINMNVPLRSKPTLGVTISGGSFVFKDTLNNWNVSPPLGIQTIGPSGGISAGLVGISADSLTGYAITCNGHTTDLVYQSFVIQLADGTIHKFPTSLTADIWGCYAGGAAAATDGSGYTLQVTSGNNGTGPYWMVYAANGSHSVDVLSLGGTSITHHSVDSNGNDVARFDGTNYYDALGTVVFSLSTGSSQLGTYTDASGSPVTVNYNTHTGYVPVWGACPWTPYTGQLYRPISSSVHFPDSLVFAVGTSQQQTLSFGYEQINGNSTGRLASLTLPTGGTINFAYSGGTNGINCIDGTTNTLTRTTTDGTWTYVHTPPASGSAISYTTVKDPLGNETDYTFSGQFVVQVVQKDSHGSQMADSFVCYNGIYSGCNAYGTNYTATITPPITVEDVYSRQTGQTQYTVTRTTFDPSVAYTLTDKKVYASGQPGSGPTGQVIEVNTPRGSWNGTNCAAVGNYIEDRPCRVYVYDGSGNLKAQTTFAYDSHGNRTTTKSYPVINGTPLTSSATYNGNGTVATTTDVNGTQTTYAYNGTGGCNNLLLTSSTVAGMTNSQTWDCNGGVVTSTTDPNGAETDSIYTGDPFWGITGFQDQLENVTNFARGILFGAGAGSFADLIFNGGLADSNSAVGVDAYNRPVAFAISETPAGTGELPIDQVIQSYDSAGRIGRLYMPCTNTTSAWGPPNWSCSTPYTSYAYDALNRISSVTDGAGNVVTTYGYTAATVNGNNVLDVLVTGSGKTTNLQYDALGNVTSVCEVSSQSGSGPCGQAVAETGFKTSYSYDTLGNLLSVTQGAQTRSFQYDALGRVTSEMNPESGTTTYVYDADSYCGNGPGDLIRKSDANGNYTCFYFDGLHRPIVIFTHSGPNTAVEKIFVYDAIGYGFGNGTNLMGRLAFAGTCHNPDCSSWYTQEAFGYDARGQLTDMWESTPHSGGTYHTTATYWANGALASLGGIPGQSTFTFGVDGEGRPASATWGSETLVSEVLFNPASQVTDIDFGNGDGDDYQYDANTGKPTQYNFTVGATPKTETGTLTWNTNGTLDKLVLSDPFNSGDTQTCTYGYDDIARLSGANCGSVWSQTFSYDQYGNITKSGSISWQPGYSASTNRYTLGGTSYDSNGNLLKDTFHTYTWNVDNQPVTIDSTSITYDAFGRQLEKGSGSSYTEFLYSPIGKVAYMNGQTTTRSLVPLPGGSTFECLGSPCGVYAYQEFHHKDWLGSTRLVSENGNRLIWSDMAFAPFGENYAGSGQTDLNFTGQQQDTVAGTYDFPARKYNPNQGRWLSPDPAGLKAVDPTNPQTWNRYAYVRNNPLVGTDPSGLFQDLIGDMAGDNWTGDTGHFVLTGEIVGSLNSGTTCILDGVEQDCGSVSRQIQGGSAAVCPGACSGFANGQYTEYVASAAAQGYVSFSDRAQGLYEVNGGFYTSAQYNQYVQSTYGPAIEDQREAAAQTIADNSITAFAGDWTTAYEKALADLDTSQGYLWGGNYNFLATKGLNPNSLNCGGDSRCNGIHFLNANGDWYVHLDTANPLSGPRGLAAHTGVDVFLGWFGYIVIPRPWP